MKNLTSKQIHEGLESFKINQTVYKTIEELPSAYQLITNSQDIKAIAEYIGLDQLDYYGCLFVNQADGDYISIYGCTYSVPMLHYEVEKIL